MWKKRKSLGRNTVEESGWVGAGKVVHGERKGEVYLSASARCSGGDEASPYAS